MQQIHNIFHWTMVVTVFGHILCCGLPAVVSVISLISGLGIIASMPMGLVVLHGAIHSYETQLIVFSGMMIVLGWALHEVSRRMNCHDTGCGHPPCAPKKKKSTKLLIFATVLFFINLSVYFGFEHGQGYR